MVWIINGIDINRITKGLSLILSACRPNKIITVISNPMIENGFKFSVSLFILSFWLSKKIYLVIIAISKGKIIYKTTEPIKVSQGIVIPVIPRSNFVITGNARIKIKSLIETWSKV